MEKTITLEGKPYFILEGESGIFSVVSAITETLAENEDWGWDWDDDEDIGHLRKGLDITETPNIDYTIFVRTTEKDLFFPYFLQKLGNLAKSGDHDCFSYENFGNYIAKFLDCINGEDVYEVKPRLFRLKSLDDKL